MTATVHEVIAAMLDAHAQRLTPARREIVDVLADAPGPLTIPEILATRTGLAQSSVYRNLAVLESAGVVTRDERGDLEVRVAEQQLEDAEPAV